MASEKRSAERVRDILVALADLAPTGEERTSSLSVPTEWFRWLPVSSVALLGTLADVAQGSATATATVTVERSFGEKLAAIDQLRPQQHPIRVGWLFVAGTATGADGRARKVFHPLVSAPVRVTRSPGLFSSTILRSGDVTVTDLVTDPDQKRSFEALVELGGGGLADVVGERIPPALLAKLFRLRHFAREVAHAAGFLTEAIVPAEEGPETLLRAEGLVIVAGIGIYAAHDTGSTTRAGSLRAWASSDHSTWTSFHSLYLGTARGAQVLDAADVISPYPLTPSQRRAVIRSRSDGIALISGAPGTGKSHTVASIALDAMGRGQSVLVAAKSDASVDALLDLFELAPGADPVVFGSTERRDALAARLEGGQVHPDSSVALERAHAELDDTVRRRDLVRRHIEQQLRVEAMSDDSATDAADALAADIDLERVRALLARARDTDGWLAARRSRKALDELCSLVPTVSEQGVERVEELLDGALLRRAAQELRASGGLVLDREWSMLLELDAEVRERAATWLAAQATSPDRLDRHALGALAALATALRSGRAARREQLARLDDRGLTKALPLWIGTLADIEDLLPTRPAMFDLVILDEATSIDQLLAAPALLRGARVVVVGDPRQLRHVSFLSDDRLASALASSGLTDDPILTSRLDVRRNSIFDVAAGVASVVVLDEHFRSEPHLVDFVFSHLYDERITIATRSPRTESKDCIEVVRLEGHRNRAGVVEAEVEWVVSELHRLHRAGVESVGVISPFRAQADAIEEAVLDAFSVDAIEALDLRIGTAHAFQGNERDVVLASMGVGDRDAAAAWRFVEDPHVFAVLASRARHAFTVVVSGEPPAHGLLDRYLAQADQPPQPPPSGRPRSPWTAAVADDLDAAGLDVRTSYPIGRHEVDICIAAPNDDVAVECDVHRDGPEAHVERRLALTRAGWTIADAYRSRWSDERAALVVELSVRFRT